MKLLLGKVSKRLESFCCFHFQFGRFVSIRSFSAVETTVQEVFYLPCLLLAQWFVLFPSLEYSVLVISSSRLIGSDVQKPSKRFFCKKASRTGRNTFQKLAVSPVTLKYIVSHIVCLLKIYNTQSQVKCVWHPKGKDIVNSTLDILALK